MTDALPGELQIGPQRQAPAVAHVVLAVGGDRHVDGQHEGIEARGGDAVDQRLDARRLARNVGLVPGRMAFTANVLHADERGRAENHRDVDSCRRAREHQIALIGADGRGTHGRDAERQRVFAAEQGRRQAPARHVGQHARNEGIVLIGVAIGAHRGIGLRSAGDEACQWARQMPHRRLFEIRQRQEAAQVPRHLHLGPRLRPLAARRRLVRARRRPVAPYVRRHARSLLPRMSEFSENGCSSWHRRNRESPCPCSSRASTFFAPRGKRWMACKRGGAPGNGPAAL